MSGTSPVSAAGCRHATPKLAAHARSLRIVLIVTVVFMVAEIVGGLMANSLALLADAGHMLTDAAAIALSLIVAGLAQRPATPERTYGYLRLEILAALVNGTALFVIAGGIMWEAVQRFGNPPEIRSGLMLAVAVAGLFANLFSMRVLHAGHSHSLNVRGAYLHVVSDMLGSVGAIGASLVIMATGWYIADPIISVVISLLILASAWRLVVESVEVLLEMTPRSVSLHEVESAIADIDGVTEVHDLHVWTVTSGVLAMSGHAIVEDSRSNQRVLETACQRMDALGIGHVTLQIERDPMCEESVPA